MKVLLLLVLAFVSAIWAQGTCPRCTPLCVNGDGTPKMCGDDGCGNSCGTCSFGQECCRGQCVCVPNCAGRICGDDGCGGSACGTCSPSQSCSNGVCVGTATPDCSGRTCGSNRAGGNCGTCGSGQRCRAGQCECYYDCNEKNCGNAVQPDGTNFGLCPQRSCGTCPTGFTCGSNGRCSASTPCNVLITVVDCASRTPLKSASTVVITSTTISYTSTVTVSAGVAYNWTTPGLGSFSFQSSSQGYLTNTQSFTLTATTTSIELCMNPAVVQLDVRNRITNVSIEVAATVTYSGVISGSLRWTGVTTFTHGGYGSYSFVATPDSRYTNGNLNTQITSTTTLVIIYVDPLPIPVTVVNCATGAAITQTASVQITSGSSYSMSLSVSAGGSSSWSYPFFGSFTFTTSATSYITNVQSFSISASTSKVQLCVQVAHFCGDHNCDSDETATTCQKDCVSLFFEFENADGSGPVNQPTMNYYLQAPLDANADTGPNRNSVQYTSTRTTGNGSNTVLEEVYGYNILIWVETVVSSFINFYWRANTSLVDPGLGVYRLRVHLSKTLGSTDFNYRLVNTWRPIDAEPAPYAPTDLNLHLFHPAGALDINNPTLLSGGFAIGKAIADSKQSGGPATMDISPGSNAMVAVWNSKPPRSSVIAPSQNGRYLVDSGSYVVFYGKTSNAANGKQLGEVVLDEILLNNPSEKTDHTSDLWYIAQFTVNQPAVNQPSIVGQATFKKSTINSNKDMIFDCQAYAYCASFVVPYSDTGR